MGHSKLDERNDLLLISVRNLPTLYKAATACIHDCNQTPPRILTMSKKGLSPIYTLQLAAKFGFQPRTLKPDNFGPPTLEKVQLSTFWAVLRMNSNF